tara:strand:- start:1514 stop:2071 length:558 start_codon:yes stop_codon:yes gene_type:complete
MKKIGITGSLASGKTTASNVLSKKRGPLFSADNVVKKLYKSNKFKNQIKKKFSLKNTINLKKTVRDKILENRLNIRKLEKIVHPLVRGEMQKFIKKNKKKPLLFFEIPLLIESKLMKMFDLIIFIKATKSLRIKRFISKGGNKKLFQTLNDRQLADKEKIKYCDYVVVNETNKNILKNNLLSIIL